ncbi:MAG TPA: aminoacyl-tRNA hydrolase [Hyphomicrobium sp.]|nr:aminoacyl-tRNA hydrolase [Hyphomicrobium sp.]
MKLFVGLGNPGPKYEANRHNIGFMALDAIARAHDFPSWRKKFQGLVSEGAIDGARVMLLKPETYMNESGRSVGEAIRFLKIDPADVVVFHDELDLTPSKVKVKLGGGNAGHNGLRSISAHIGNEYVRVRLGIGHPGSRDAVTYYVLNDFAKAERAWVGELLDALARAAHHLAEGDEARFLSDVARFMQQAEASNSESRKSNRTPPPGAPASPKDEAPAPQPKANKPHPAGERANKRQSALAENLKKWLGSRKSNE